MPACKAARTGPQAALPSPTAPGSIMFPADSQQTWQTFLAINHFRRAIRQFDPEPVAQQDIHALLCEAALAPSSGNLQPYQFHWVRTPALKTAVALACHGQKAATSASDLIVVTASPAIARRTAAAQLVHVDTSSHLTDRSKAYYRRQIGKFQKILCIGALPVWSPLLFLAALARPALALLPIGQTGSRHWAARNAIFAAQTLMFGAAAKGIDSCPMEGFSATRVAELLQLPRGTVIPLVIALGYRAGDAGVEERWRRPIRDLIHPH